MAGDAADVFCFAMGLSFPKELQNCSQAVVEILLQNT